MARVPYVTQTELDSEYEDLIVSSLQPGQTLNVYSSIANNPAVLEGLRAFLGSLWTDSGLSDRERELVILTTASEMGSAYEWHQHENIAGGAGVSQEEVRAIARDDREPFTEREKALLAYTRAVVRNRVTDALHATLVEYFDDETVVGAAATAAGYAALSLVIAALDVEIESGETFVGWDPE